METTGYRDNVVNHPNQNSRNSLHIEAAYADDYNGDGELPPAWEEYRFQQQQQQAGTYSTGNVTPHNWRHARRMRYLLRYCLPALLVILLIAVGSKIVASNQQNNFNFDDLSLKAAQVATIVTQMGWSKRSTFAMGTPQWQAAQWLGDLDPLQLDMDELERTVTAILYPNTVVVPDVVVVGEHANNDTSNDDNDAEQKAAHLNEFQQRYVLAVVYYALNGANWLYELDFLSGDSVCGWNQMWQINPESIGPGNSNSNSTGSSSTTIPFLAVGANCLDSDEIKQLILPANNLQGSIPAEIGLLTALQELNLYGNYLTATLPDSMASLTRLRSVSLHNNTLTGPLAPWLLGDNMPDLASLNLARNKFTGKMSHKLLSKMTSLHTLNLGNNNLHVPDLKALAVQALSVQYMPALRNLFLQDNSVHGTLGKDWVETHWAALEVIDLSDNFLTGSIPVSLLQLSNLTVLDLHGNGLTGKFPKLHVDTSSSSGGSQLSFLALHENSLTGAIPTHIGAFFSDHLIHLDLSKNKFSSNIPTEIFQLTNLVYLFLAFNDFEIGMIPDEIANLTQLVDLSLKETNMRGTIPDVIGKHLSNLVLLDLDGNEIHGSIPSSLGDLEHLRFLFLSHNKLHGLIPTTLGKLHNIQLLLLHSNQLTGQAPIEMCEKSRSGFGSTRTNANLEFLDVFMSDCVHIKDYPDKFNNQIADVEVACSCCTVCCEDSVTEVNVCNAHEWYGEQDPIWEYRYTRTAYLFNDGDLVYPALP